MDKPVAYEVSNRITGQDDTLQDEPAASRAQDRMDWDYGAVCTTRRAIWEN
jgi:hypothetical protein